MSKLTPEQKKPKNVITVEEAAIQHNQIKNDPALKGLLTGPETAPVPANVRAQQIAENIRRGNEARVASEANGKNGIWAFVKNQNPKETIKFSDGTDFNFPDNLYICKDEKIAEKIKEVSERYGIVLK